MKRLIILLITSILLKVNLDISPPLFDGASPCFMLDISKNINKYDAFIALGCVIKGETPHFDLISKAAIDGIMKLSIEHKKPIGNGIITSLNKKQALNRSNLKKKNVSPIIELLFIYLFFF